MLRLKPYLGFLGAILFACCLAGVAIFAIRSGQLATINPYPTAIVQVIPAPTLTPSPQPTFTPSAVDGFPESPSANFSGEEIQIGDSVQIYGTQGDGLRLRASPGLDGKILFLAYEGEIFRVEDGPQDASGYRWWYLVAPYDINVYGWAAANFLKVVEGGN